MSGTPPGDKNCDIAISFMFRDELLAREMTDRLSEAYVVFLFSKRQEELAGSSGIEEFRDVFFRRARLVVVLYRPEWGETPWTRIERMAIEERFLRDGPEFLLFVMMNSADPRPKWLPETRIRLNFDQFGLEQLLGAIKHRLELLGAQPRPDHPTAHARRVADAATFHKNRQKIYDSEEGVAAAATEAEAVIDRLNKLVAEVHQSTPELEISGSGTPRIYVITNRRVSLHTSWHNMVSNMLRDDAVLYVGEYVGHVPDPTSNQIIVFQPKETASVLYKPELDRALGWCWRQPGGKLWTSSELARRCIDAFLDLVDRGNRGKLPSLIG
jgi:hypothetical protein